MRTLGYQAAFAELTNESHLHCGSHCPPTTSLWELEQFNQGYSAGLARIAVLYPPTTFYEIGYESFPQGQRHCPPTTDIEEIEDFRNGWLSAAEDEDEDEDEDEVRESLWDSDYLDSVF